jgi:hypothetical protein
MKRWGNLLVLLSIFLVISTACNKNAHIVSLKYTPEEFDHLSSGASSVSPVGINAIPFSDYSPGVNKINSKTLIFERLKFYAVELESEELAKNEALRLNQYYSRNYLLDRVEGEPILEDYVIKTFSAKNPNRTLQRSPKKEEGHQSEHAPHATTHQ